MVYGTILQTPDFPITEQWVWETDVIESFDGSENRISLLRFPKRSFSGTFTFDNLSDLHRHLALMTKRYSAEFVFPLFQYHSKLKNSAAVGATSLTVTTRRLNIAVGENVIVLEGGKSETVTVSSVSAGALQLATPLASSFTKRAIVCPVATVYPSDNSNVTRKTVDSFASSSFRFTERVPRSNILSANNTVTLSRFDELALLPYVAIGDEFEEVLQTGQRPVEYLSQNDLISPWELAQWNYNPTFMWTEFDRNSGNDTLDWWEAFANEIQGSSKPFLFSTGREDFSIVTPASLNGTTITVEGTGYSEHYFDHDAFRRIAIATPMGIHYAKVTSVTVVGGNDRLTFTPALPNVAGWGNGQKVSFLLKVRLANDTMTFRHHGLHTEVQVPIRTVS